MSVWLSSIVPVVFAFVGGGGGSGGCGGGLGGVMDSLESDTNVVDCGSGDELVVFLEL